MFVNLLSIGLTGGIGSGKTTVSDIFAKLGANIIDTDVIAHDICAPNGIAISEIKNQFGNSYIQSDGAMDRTKMRHLVFNDVQAKQQLEAILHPLIRQQTELAAQNSKGLYNIFVIPLLLESKQWLGKLDRILVIDCTEETQIVRVMKRNGFSREEVVSVMKNQVTRQERLKYADDLIHAEESIPHIRHQVEQLHQKYMKLL